MRSKLQDMVIYKYIPSIIVVAVANPQWVTTKGFENKMIYSR